MSAYSVNSLLQWAHPMGIVNRYVLRQIAAPMLLALIAVVIVGIAGDIQWRIRDPPLRN